MKNMLIVNNVVGFIWDRCMSSYVPLKWAVTRKSNIGENKVDTKPVTKELEKHRGRLGLPMLLPMILVETRLQTAVLGV